MKNRQGQALIIVVIIIAVIMAVFANSFTTQLHYHAQEEIEIYQREQALYLAETGINQMIFKINNGKVYSNGNKLFHNDKDSPSGVGKYNAIYTSDTSFGGTATIKGVGEIGKFTRIVYASVQSGGSSDAFKYCLYTKKGKYKKTNNDGSEITFTNKNYGSNYYYNSSAAVTPYPDWSWYTNPDNYPQGVFHEYDVDYDDAIYNPFNASDQGKVVYIHYTGKKKNATLIIEFVTSSFWDGLNGKSTIQISIITDYPVVTFKNIGEYALPYIGIVSGLDITWNPVYYDSNHQYPAFIHMPSLTSKSSILFDYEDSANDTHTFKINGLIYSNSPVEFEYGEYYRGFINIRSELIAKSLTTDWDYAETIFDYDPDGNSNYFLYPPPHFIVPDNVTKVFPSSFREEY